MDLTSVLESGQNSDATIRCAGREWKVHCGVLYPQSPYFNKAFNSGFREGQTRVIELEEDPKHVELLLNFAYGSMVIPDEFDAFDVVTLHAAMDKYLFERFQNDTASVLGGLSLYLIDIDNHSVFVELLLHTLKYPDVQVAQVREMLEEITTMSILSLIPLPEFQKALKAWPSLGTQSLLNMPARIEEATFDKPFELQHTVKCTVASCNGTNRSWSFRGGPSSRTRAYCITCGGTNRLNFGGHKDLPESRAVHLTCSATECESKGAIWQVFNAIRHNSRIRPYCIWCGRQNDLQIVLIIKDPLSGTCALCPSHSL